FDFTAAGLPGELPLFGGDSLRTANASLSLPLYTGGRTRSAIDAADATLRVRRRETGSMAQDVKLETAERYIAVLRAESLLASEDARTASLAAHERDVRSMFDNGEVPRNELLAAGVSLANAEQ